MVHAKPHSNVEAILTNLNEVPYWKVSHHESLLVESSCKVVLVCGHIMKYEVGKMLESKDEIHPRNGTCILKMINLEKGNSFQIKHTIFFGVDI